jgi:hypothetical protein
MWASRGKRIGAAVAVVATSVLFVGLYARGQEDRGSQAMVGNLQAFDTASAGGGGGAGGAVAATAPPATGDIPDSLPAAIASPRIVKTATLRIEVDDKTFGRAFSEVATIASSAGGFVASSTSYAGDGDEHGLASGSLVLRVPAEQFDAVRQKVRGLGDLQSEEIQGEDVGAQLTDVEARLRNLRSQEEAIRELMRRAGNVGETLQVQNQLGSVRGEIEQLAAQQARLTDAVNFATITVQLSEPGATPGGDPSPLRDALDRAVEGAESIIAGMIVLFGYLFPIAVVVLIALTIHRIFVRRATAFSVTPTEASAEHHA